MSPGRFPRALCGAALASIVGASDAATQTAVGVPLAPPFTSNGGSAYTVAAPADWTSDDPTGERSRVMLYEDGVALGPAHALHQDIRENGAGRFSHWGGVLYFSSSDNSDPNTNGRVYSATLLNDGPGEADYRILPPRDVFRALEPSRLARGWSAPEDPPEDVAPPPLIYWYTIDALRADLVDARLDGTPLMPALSAFAEEAVRFETAYAASSFTKTSTASMFTGLWPLRHGVMHGVVPTWPRGAALLFDLDPRFYTLAEFLAEHGYATATHPYTVHVRPGDGMLQGFLRTDLASHADVPLDEVPPRLFVYEHILGVHGPYDPSQQARERLGLPEPEELDPASTAWFDMALDDAEVDDLWRAYLGEAVDADARLARRLAWIREQGLWDDALVIVTADHGEEFLEHGATQHSVQLYEEVVRVPLMVKFPESHRWSNRHGSLLENRVRLVDLYPTIVEMVAGTVEGLPYALDGESLAAILEGDERDPRARDVLLRTSFTTKLDGRADEALIVTDALLSDRYKAHLGYRIRSSQAHRRHSFRQGEWFAELYDLVSDPGEFDNLVGDRTESFLELAARLKASAAPLSVHGAEPLLPDDPTDDGVDEELLETLRSLGYVR